MGPKTVRHLPARLVDALGDWFLHQTQLDKPTFHFQPHRHFFAAYCVPLSAMKLGGDQKDGATTTCWSSATSSTQANSDRHLRPPACPAWVGRPAMRIKRRQAASYWSAAPRGDSGATPGLSTLLLTATQRDRRCPGRENSCTGWMTHRFASSQSPTCPLWANRPGDDPVAVGNVRDSGPGPRNHCAGVSCRRRSMFPRDSPAARGPIGAARPKEWREAW